MSKNYRNLLSMSFYNSSYYNKKSACVALYNI